MKLVDCFLGVGKAVKLGVRAFKCGKVTTCSGQPSALCGGAPIVVQTVAHQEFAQLQLCQIWPGVETMRQAFIRDGS
jgi:hypothetical protein